MAKNDIERKAHQEGTSRNEKNLNETIRYVIKLGYTITNEIINAIMKKKRGKTSHSQSYVIQNDEFFFP